MRVLYISYDGALDPLGRSQVVPLLEHLARAGNDIHLLSFEKRDALGSTSHRDMHARLATSGIAWHPLRYHRGPSGPATAFDLSMGLAHSTAILFRHKIQLVHARSYPATLIALQLKRAFSVPYLFDMRGLYPEERLEAGIWAESSRIFKISKRLERTFLRHAASVVTLTNASVPLLRAAIAAAHGAADLEVIPITVDLDKFRIQTGPREPFVLAYFGSVGTWYRVPEMLHFGRTLLEVVPASRMMFLVNQGGDLVRTTANETGLPMHRLDIRSVDHERVPEALANTSATISLYRPGHSKIATSPTKLGESLALGIPAVVNTGVGDAAELVAGNNVGAVIEDIGADSFLPTVNELLSITADPATAQRCREVAERIYSVQNAAARYSELYESMVRAG